MLFLSGCIKETPKMGEEGGPEMVAINTGEGTDFSDLAVSGNAKCTFTSPDVNYIYYFKDGDYMIDMNDGQIIMVKKGNLMYNYMNFEGQEQCTMYNIDELKDVFGNDWEEQSMQGSDFSMTYKDQALQCDYNVVSDLDINIPSSNCQDMTSTIKAMNNVEDIEDLEDLEENPFAPSGEGVIDTSELFEGVMTITFIQAGKEAIGDALEVENTLFGASKPVRLYKGSSIYSKVIKSSFDDVDYLEFDCDAMGSKTMCTDISAFAFKNEVVVISAECEEGSTYKKGQECIIFLEPYEG